MIIRPYCQLASFFRGANLAAAASGSVDFGSESYHFIWVKSIIERPNSQPAPMPVSDTDTCQLCGRSFPRAQLTSHHLIPRALHRKKRIRKLYNGEELQRTVSLCALCHRHIHRLFTEKELVSFSTLDALRAHPQVAKWIQWRRKQKF